MGGEKARDTRAFIPEHTPQAEEIQFYNPSVFVDNMIRASELCRRKSL